MTQVLLQTILGEHFDAMPESVRRMHSIKTDQTVHGVSRVMKSANSLGALIRFIAILPSATHRIPLTIRFKKKTDSEIWDRYFGNSRFQTRMKQEGRHMAEHLVPFPVVFVYEVKADHRGFSLHTTSVRFCGIRLPRILWPSIKARAYAWRGKYRFSTMIGFSFCGRVISYFGFLDAP